MSRLDDIVARNKNPRRFGRAGFPIGIGVAIFVLLILVLMIFTDLDESPSDAPPPPPAPEKGRVHDVQLRVERHDARTE